jgi:hypothetical protein
MSIERESHGVHPLFFPFAFEDGQCVTFQRMQEWVVGHARMMLQHEPTGGADSCAGRQLRHLGVDRQGKQTRARCCARPTSVGRSGFF